jgi:hypothetical protein
MVGCSAAKPLRKRRAEAVRMTRMETGWCWKAAMMFGSLIVATEPLCLALGEGSQVKT